MDEREKALDAFFRKNDSSQKKKYVKEAKTAADDGKIDAYFEEVAAKKEPIRKSKLDKIFEFFKMTSFKNKFDEKKVASNRRQIEVEGKTKFTLFWNRLVQFFISRFSFESGVDILDETSVLYRRNLVIKNILWITNIVFMLFTIIGSEGTNISTNIIIAIVIFLVMFFTNMSIKKMIHGDPKSMQKQAMAEYMSGVYILLMAITVYIKLKLTLDLSGTATEGFFSITMAGYSLIYFALVVLALYQDSRLLSVMFKITMIAMTIIHILVLYPLYQYGDIVSLWEHIRGPVITDLLLRTLVLVVFMIALYSTARITEDMNNKRKEELIKRRSMEKDFKSVVSDVFDVISVYKRNNSELEESQKAAAVRRVAELAGRLGNYLGYSPSLCKEIFDFSTIHVDKKEALSLTDYEQKDVLDEADFRKIREKTIIGSVIIKRLQLEQKGEEIVRAHFEKTADADFIKEMNSIQNNRESQVILLAEIYEILRQDRNYKRGLKHARAIDLLQLEFYPYFDSQILDRFVKYTDDFEALYYKATQA
ncbi:MAG: hypothetical protein A2Y16_06260 [Tenericutes bacterium GWF2_57_13]|nr:MAG: hypothetical protein A2Y16_06260 [Tenericutes bacterium GWF2_57_13]